MNTHSLLEALSSEAERSSGLVGMFCFEGLARGGSGGGGMFRLSRVPWEEVEVLREEFSERDVFPPACNRFSSYTNNTENILNHSIFWWKTLTENTEKYKIRQPLLILDIEHRKYLKSLFFRKLGENTETHKIWQSLLILQKITEQIFEIIYFGKLFIVQFNTENSTYSQSS